jgi:hypothetical protein
MYIIYILEYEVSNYIRSIIFVSFDMIYVALTYGLIHT